MVKVEDVKSVVKEVDADAKRSMSPGTVKVEEAKAVVEEPPSNAEPEVDMMDEQTQPIEGAGSGLHGSAKKKLSLASKLLKRTKTTIGLKGKDKDNSKEVKKRGPAMHLALRSASKSVFSSLFTRK
jgi:hypothetical protein